MFKTVIASFRTICAMGSVLGLVGCNNGNAQVKGDPNIKTDPAVLEKAQLMEGSGFKVSFGDGGLIFLPNGDGTYRIIARLYPSNNAILNCSLREHPTGKYDSFTVCDIDSWKAPIGFETSLVSSAMDSDTFWEAIALSDLSNLYEPSNIVRSEIFTPEFNLKILTSESKVWKVCWDTNIQRFGPTIMVQSAKRIDCRDGKGKLQILFLKDELQQAKDKNDKVTKELEKKLGVE